MRILIPFLLLSFIQNGAAQIIPNDPLYSQQRYIQDLKIDKAWELSQGSPGHSLIVFSSGGTVQNPDILGSRFSYPFIHGYNLNTIGSPKSLSSGGVTAIFGANTNNNFGIAGINWHSSILHENFVRIDRKYVYSGTLLVELNELKEETSLIKERLTAYTNLQPVYRETKMGLIMTPL